MKWFKRKIFKVFNVFSETLIVEFCREKYYYVFWNMKVTVYFAFAVYKNCAEVYKAGQRISGVCTIKPDNGVPFDVFCDQKTAGGGWTVFQKRIEGSVDFYRGWDDYKRGFGNLNGEFWLGLDKVHRLTKERSMLERLEWKDSARWVRLLWCSEWEADQIQTEPWNILGYASLTMTVLNVQLEKWQMRQNRIYIYKNIEKKLRYLIKHCSGQTWNVYKKHLISIETKYLIFISMQQGVELLVLFCFYLWHILGIVL